MKKNSKNKIRLMSKSQLHKRFNYLKSKRTIDNETNMMRYLRYQLRTRYNETI